VVEVRNVELAAGNVGKHLVMLFEDLVESHVVKIDILLQLQELIADGLGLLQVGGEREKGGEGLDAWIESIDKQAKGAKEKAMQTGRRQRGWQPIPLQTNSPATRHVFADNLRDG
jgi:hypothetical protein